MRARTQGGRQDTVHQHTGRLSFTCTHTPWQATALTLPLSTAIHRQKPIGTRERGASSGPQFLHRRCGHLGDLRCLHLVGRKPVHPLLKVSLCFPAAVKHLLLHGGERGGEDGTAGVQLGALCLGDADAADLCHHLNPSDQQSVHQVVREALVPLEARYPHPDLEVVLALVAQATHGGVALEVLLGRLAIDCREVKVGSVPPGKALSKPERHLDLGPHRKVRSRGHVGAVEEAAAHHVMDRPHRYLLLLRQNLIDVPKVCEGHGGVCEG
mmetsp:Transcript_92785/g.276800  ORF Transcript_92785/g.276800 Transcript_92785/m.276800 type:complete len:269 (-) Transcript_92785:11-817(-)